MDTVDSGEGPRGVLQQLLADDGIPRTTAEVADTMNRDVETAQTYLETLSEFGYVDSRTLDGTRLWWPADVQDVGVLKGGDKMDTGFDVLSVLPAIVYRCKQTENWPMEDVWGSSETITGYPAEALEDGSVSYGDDIVHPDDYDRIWEEIESVRETGDAFTLQYRIVTRSGETRWVWERGRFIAEDSLVGVITDIDDQKQAESELREERAFIESLFDAQQDVVYAFDRDGSMRRWNDRLPEVTGYTDDEVADLHALDLVAPEDRDRVQKEFAPVLTEGTHETVEFMVVTKDGDHIPYEVTAAPLHEDGEITGVTGVAREITDRIERERELEQQRDELESELSDIFERVDDAFFALDDEWRFTYVNDRATEVLERSEAELLGTSIWEEFPGAVGSEFEEAYRDAMETQEPVSFESFYPPLDRWFEVNAYPSESGLSVYFQDITERKARTQRVERANRRYRTLLDNFPNGAVTLYDTDLVCQAAGGENVERVGLSEAEMVGEYLGDVVPQPWREELVDRYERVLEGERQRFEVQDDGRIFEVTGVPIRDGDGEVTSVLGISQDVTEHRRRERELERSERRYRTLVDNFPNGAVALVDHDLRYQTVGGTPIDSVTAEELLGSKVDEVLSDELAEVLVPAYRDALAGESRDFETKVGDTYSRIMTIPVRDEDGEVFAAMGMSQDITEKKEYEQYLQDAKEQLEAATEAGAVGTWEWHVQEDTMVAGQSFARVFGIDPETAREGVSLDRFIESIHEDDREPVIQKIDDALESCGEYHAEYRVWNDDDELRWVEARGHVECDEDGDPVTFPGALIDITEHRERERELEHYETLAETAADVLIRVDTESIIRDVNPAVSDIFGHDPDELEGESLTTLMPDRLTKSHREGIQNYIETGERTLDWNYIELPAVRKDGTEIDVAISFSEYEHRGERFFTGIIRDITERKEREQALQDAYEIIADPGRSLDEKINDLLDSTRQKLGMEYATLSSISDDQYTFEYLQAPDGAEITAGTQIPLGEARNCESVVANEKTLVLQNIPRDAPENEDPNFGIETYIGSPVMVGGEPYGTFCFYGTEPRDESFSDWEVTFVELLSNWVGYALDRERTTLQLEALNSLHNTIREITHVAFSQSTREEIEHAACERLADSPSYEFAWIADHNPRSRTIEARTAVATNGYESDVYISFDGPESEGPTARAFRTREVQTVQNVFEDPNYEPWRDLALEYGFQSSAAIPIVHEESVYGVLNLYAGRPNAFEGRELDVLAQLGEILGHAIAAAERKRALMSDELVEVEFAIDDLFGKLIDGFDHSGRIVLQNTVPTGDGEFLIYGFVEAGGLEPLEQIVEQVPHWTNLNVVSDGDPIRFEVSLSEPPVLTSVASHGGAVQHAEIVDGDFFMRIRLPREGDVRQIIETVQEAYPESEVLTHRQVTRDDDRSPHLQSTWSESLTDKQRSALEAAYHAGYFSWPRDASGEDLADSLGVSPPTFYQHLRAAEAKLFGALLDDDDEV